MTGRGTVGRISVRRAAATAALALAALAAAPSPGHAQFWPFKRHKKPEVPTQPAAPSMPQLPQAPLLPQAQGAAAQGGAAPAVPAQTPEEAAKAAQAADRERYLREARARELARDTTVQNAQDRLNAWALVRAIDPADPEAAQGSERARQDLALARGREQSARTQAVDSTTKAQVRTQLRTANAAAESGDTKGAESQVNAVLAEHPEDPQARSLQAALAARRKAEEARKLYLMLGGGLLLGGGGAGVLAWRALRSARDRAKQDRQMRRAHVQVVDGVGRGRLVPVEGMVFRIGAAQSDDPSAHNDLVLSDAARAISRHHCTIMKRDGRHYLLDASLNGTTLNGDPVARGEDRRLEDGDEFVLADSTRLKFLVSQE